MARKNSKGLTKRDNHLVQAAVALYRAAEESGVFKTGYDEIEVADQMIHESQQALMGFEHCGPDDEQAIAVAVYEHLKLDTAKIH